MAYAIKTTNGSALTTIADGTVNVDSSSLTLIGKNYAGYGAFFNENFVKLLENFSNTTAPSSALTGQLWYDSNSQILKVYNEALGGVWKPISSTATGVTAPIGPVTGDLWWDTANAQLKVNNENEWVTIGPVYSSTAGTSGAQVETILDSAGGAHVVVKFYVANDVVGIISKDAAFTPQTAIPGFSTIKPGMNIASDSAIAGSQYTGSVSNAITVGGILPSQFLRNDQDASTNYTISAAGGLEAGSDLALATVSGAGEITNPTLNSDINLYVNKAGVSTKALALDGTTGAVTVDNAIYTNSNNTANIGTSTNKFNSIYATNFIGTAFTSTTRTAGDNSTNIATTAFVGTAITNATGSLGTMSTQNSNNVNITGGSILATTQPPGTSNTTVATTAFVQTAIPAGCVSYFAGPTAPSGWLECNGVAVSRTTYAALFAAIGGYYGIGNGSTTFNLPDARGEFIRGWDHGRGVDPGRALATFQAGTQIQSTIYQGAFIQYNNGDSFTAGAAVSRGGVAGYSSPQNLFTTRPRNIAMMVCIKT